MIRCALCALRTLDVRCVVAYIVCMPNNELTSRQVIAAAEIAASFAKTGHGDHITIGRDKFSDDDLVYVTGYKSAALDRCATIDNSGSIAWIR